MISFANSDFSQGKLYKTLGFRFIKKYSIYLYWYKGGIRESIYKFQKYKLVLTEDEINLTGKQIMINRG